MQPLRLYHPRVDRIDANVTSRQFLGQRPLHGVNSRFLLLHFTLRADRERPGNTV
jgi:hypothetical protein